MWHSLPMSAQQKSVKKTVLNEWKAMRKATGLEKGKLQYTTHIVVFC